MQDAATHDYEWKTIAPTGNDMEQCVRHWFERGAPLVWRPIFSRENFPGIDLARLIEAQAASGPCWLIARPEDLLSLPAGITGWIMPVDAEDTDVACGRWENGVTFMAINDRASGERITYQTDRRA